MGYESLWTKIVVRSLSGKSDTKQLLQLSGYQISHFMPLHTTFSFYADIKLTSTKHTITVWHKSMITH